VLAGHLHCVGGERLGVHGADAGLWPCRVRAGVDSLHREHAPTAVDREHLGRSQELVTLQPSGIGAHEIVGACASELVLSQRLLLRQLRHAQLIICKLAEGLAILCRGSSRKVGLGIANIAGRAASLGDGKKRKLRHQQCAYWGIHRLGLPLVVGARERYSALLDVVAAAQALRR
jgi:hypothetical protein